MKHRTMYELQADVCKTIANAKRLEILNALQEGEKTVTDLVEILGIPKANVSQHLTVMRTRGVLKNRREGVNIYYDIANPKVLDACSIMRDILQEHLQEEAEMAAQH